MNDEMLKVLPVISNARSTPEVESRADARIAIGDPKLRNSNNKTVNTSTIASTKTKIRSRNERCCSS